MSEWQFVQAKAFLTCGAGAFLPSFRYWGTPFAA